MITQFTRKDFPHLIQLVAPEEEGTIHCYPGEREELAAVEEELAKLPADSPVWSADEEEARLALFTLKMDRVLYVWEVYASDWS